MPKRNDLTISKRTVDGLSAAEDTVFWDHDLPGYGVRVYPTGRKVYVVQSRGPGGPKRVTLGRHGEIPAEQARGKAAGVIDRIKRGEDPVPPPPAPGLTVTDLAERYMEGHVAVNCNAHTAGIYRGSLGNHILPALGELAIEAVGREHAAALHYGLRDTPRAANRALMVLTKMFSLAEAWGLAPEGSNPCRFVVKYREHPRERFLAPEEYRRLGRVMDAAQGRGGIWRRAVAALRLLMLTGCRCNEILTLRWDDVDRTAGELRLRDAKTGARMVPLTPTAVKVLGSIDRVPGNPWVIAGRGPGAHITNLSVYWYRVREQAGLEDVRIHDLRHSYASRALALGEGLTMIGGLLGHAGVESTARYAHLARDTEKASAAKVGGSIGADIMTGENAAAHGAGAIAVEARAPAAREG